MNLDAEALASLFAAAVAAQAGSAPSSTPPPLLPHSTFRTSSARHPLPPQPHSPPPASTHGNPKYSSRHNSSDSIATSSPSFLADLIQKKKQAHPETHQEVQCPKCEFSVGTKEGLAVHISQMHKETWVCAECGVESDTKGQWQEHLRTYHGDGGPMEPVPDLASANSNQLAELMSAAAAFLQSAQMAAAAMAVSGGGGGKESRSPSPPSPPPNNNGKETVDPSPSNFARNYLCPYPECGFGTRDSRDFLHHLKDRHEEQFQIHYCHLCNYASKFPGKVTRHKALVHAAKERATEVRSSLPGSEPAEKHYKCTICPYETEEEARFKKHMRCHNTKAETSCRFCDFETVYSWNLDRHMQGHHIKGRYSCLRCTYSQNTRQSMTFHLQHHHKIQRTEAEIQTIDGPVPEEIQVQVGKEPYIFEKHAVLFHADKAPNVSSPRNSEAHTPKDTNGSSGRGISSEDDRKSSSGTSVSHIKVKKYLSEADAIETPSDERDLKEFESDPDVQSRVCSICGYQGKWISEMIRHKRVHTNERPFRCKYCSRTSKWKADLIRHVAKVHGIRVVSKYSRSKTFDSDPTVMRAMKEAHGYMESDGEMTTESHSDGGYAESQEGDESESKNLSMNDGPYGGFRIEKFASIGKSKSGEAVLKCRICGFQAGGVTDLRSHVFQHQECLKDLKLMKDHSKDSAGWSEAASGVVWRCQKCGTEASRRSEVIDHLARNHQLPPFSCSLCSFSSMFRKTVLYHLETVHGEKVEERERITENITYRIVSPVPRTNFTDKTQDRASLKRDSRQWDPIEDGDVKKRLKLDSAESEEKSIPSDDVSSLSLPGSPSALSPAESLAEVPCPLCPFVGPTEAAVAAHRKGHEKPKGLINYKCAFCDWYAKKSQMVFQHMRVHTSEPANYMAEVERNLITPLNNNNNKVADTKDSDEVTSNGATHNALEGFEPVERKIHRCKECGFSARSEDELTDHVEGHSKPKPEVTQADLTKYLAGGIFSDFSAILNAAGDGSDDEEGDPIRYPMDAQDSPSVGWSQDSMDTDSEPEIEDQESYLHAGEDAFNAGLDFVKVAPSEIKKVSIVVEGEPRRMWQCRYCPHVSKRRANVRMHEKKHFKKNPIGLLKCPKCNYRGDKRSLNAHYRVHVSDSVSMPDRYPCKICPANFRNIKDREDHVRYHNNLLPIKCTECNYSVPTQEILEMHLKVHVSEKESPPKSDSLPSLPLPKKSTTCSSQRESLKLLKNAQSLLSHGAARTGAKPKKHSCPSCPAKFADTTQLSRHVRFHGINHEHKCPHCDYSVPFKINLFKHIRSHHGLDADGCKLDKSDPNIPTMQIIPNAIENSLPILKE